MIAPLEAWRDGIGRVTRAPVVLVGMWALTLLVSLPLTITLRGMIDQHLGSSLAAESAAEGVNYEWWQEFSAQTSGLGDTFKPTIIGFGAVLDNLSALVDNERRPVTLLGAAAAYVALWIFFAGGIIDRYARNRPVRAHGFFSACGVFFFRFVRLGAVMAVVYGFLFGCVHPWLFRDLYPRLIRDVTVERTAFLVRIALYLVFGLVVAGCNLIFDYTKVRAVVEDRRSMLGAIVAALRFVWRNRAAVLALYAANAVLFALALAAYAVAAPGAGRAGLAAWIGFGIGQAYVLARLWVRLTFWAGEVSLFQGRLAHAGYAAARQPAWPDSPAAEAIAGPS
jgi:hypothetical protein